MEKNPKFDKHTMIIIIMIRKPLETGCEGFQQASEFLLVCTGSPPLTRFSNNTVS
jgi:hypothetical protein